MRAVPYAIVHDRPRPDRRAVQSAGQSLLGPARARHGQRTGGRDQPGTGGSAGVPDGAAVGAGTAALLPARRQNFRSRRGDSRAPERRVRGERGRRALQPTERSGEARPAQLPAIAVSQLFWAGDPRGKRIRRATRVVLLRSTTTSEIKNR